MNRKTVSVLTAIFLVLLISILGVFMQSQARIDQAEEETVNLVKYDFNVDKINKFYWITTDNTYFSLDFIDDEGVQHFAIVAQDGGDIQYFSENEIISEQDANDLTINETSMTNIIQTRLGLLNYEPVWEVTLKNDNNTLTYYYVNALTGLWVKTISNI